MLTPRRISLTTAVAALLLCGMSGAAIAQQDLRMPDTRDAAIAATQKQDLRSADARDTARADQIAAQMNRFDAAKPQPIPGSRIAAHQDLRSPDTRDVANGREYPPTPTVVTLTHIKSPESVPTTGFDWVAAAAGAAVMLGVILLTAAAVIVTRRRARHHQPVAAT